MNELSQKTDNIRQILHDFLTGFYGFQQRENNTFFVFYVENEQKLKNAIDTILSNNLSDFIQIERKQLDDNYFYQITMKINYS